MKGGRGLVSLLFVCWRVVGTLSWEAVLPVWEEGGWGLALWVWVGE